MATAAQSSLHIAADKLLELAELHATRRACAEARQTFVFTNGCFDLLHRGHVEYLQQARALGDCLAVGLNDDRSVRALKGPGRPLMPQADRAALLAALSCVNYVCIFSGASVEPLVADLLPDILVKGGDYAQKEIVGRRVVEAHGGQVQALPLWRGQSSSELVRRIKNLPDE
ncbi:MAG: adenylyltransferase/cytidyltransferase family protein [Candidatus Latescibacteria bacterium]|jgi:D-beta-D-heptose 7-phosphate kinase/D-beta-D-heptose 1-phosphate adenosyltransferase|nr:adenylyltransferase/cytidyltransferase family protein [Candidatus Latescibacterota bacterium]